MTKRKALSTWRRIPARLLGGLTISLALPLAAQAQKAEPLPPPVESAPVHVRTITLAEAVQLGLENQPAVAASRASLASAQTQQQALDKLRPLSLIARDLPIRRKQSERGVAVAAAALRQDEHETVYAIKRTYYSVLFARLQLRVANQVVSEFKDTRENAQRLLDGGARNVTKSDVDRTDAYVRLAETRVDEANRGVELALAALREAIGLGPEVCLQAADDTLPESRLPICKGDIIGQALARRGEMAQAALAAEITNLEVDAQGRSFALTVPTFASGSDLHARPIPQGESNGDYRPGAVGLEMPPTLVGCRADRMARARDLSVRATAVVDKTRNLITLDAENTYLRWEETSRKTIRTRQAVELLDRISTETIKDFKGGQNVAYRDVLESVVLAAQTRAQYNEALFQHAVALAALERVTAGGFCIALR